MIAFEAKPAVSVLTHDPGCVYPSIVTGPVIAGRGVVGEMVLTPDPEMLNLIMSGPEWEFAFRIACRSEPEPELFVFVTVYVDEPPATSFSF
jgi:hypothetical protein